jgi:aminopeptidase N
MKAGLWETLMHDETLSNYELFALAEFFFRPAQRELTAPYVERYFRELPQMPQSRTGMMAERLAATLFPSAAVSAETLRLAEDCLADESLPQPVRRPIADCADDLARALRSKETFGW